MGTDDFFHKRRRQERKRKVAPDRFLIVCEGVQTEPNYFNTFKKAINKKRENSVSIEIDGTGKNTISLVDHTIRLMNKANPDYTNVWCVFDRDSFPKDNFDNAISKASQYGIEVAYSNEAFELWYLLHFYYIDSKLSRDQYIDMLNAIFENKLGKKYKKNDALIFHDINNIGNEEFAIRNAERLLEFHLHNSPEKSKPSTTVHKLVKQLKMFI